MLTPFNLVLFAVVINVATFAAFGIDKRRAVAGAWRVSESNLLTLAAFGGSPAAFLARRHFRHKTRKQPFSAILCVIAIIQAGLAIGVGSVFVERLI